VTCGVILFWSDDIILPRGILFTNDVFGSITVDLGATKFEGCDQGSFPDIAIRNALFSVKRGGAHVLIGVEKKILYFLKWQANRIF
jgi:hypothetical protein